ncbi:MAG: hypothetical protein ABIM40_00490 [Pseudomonadota bacterium]
MKKTALFLLLILAVAGGFSCSAAKNQGPAVPAALEPRPGQGLRHMAALAPFTDATAGAPTEDGELSRQVAGLVADGCGGGVVILPFSPPGLPTPPASTPMGLDASEEWVEAARRAGADILVGGILWDSVVVAEKRGIYGFREKVPVAKARLNVWAYDTLTGAKILDEAVDCETILEQMKMEGLVAEEAAFCPPVLREDLTSRGARAVCRTLEKADWRAFVTSVDGEILTVAAGARSGVAPGREFLVHDLGEPVSGPGGKVLLLPGKPTGRVTITEVEENQSQARLIEGQAPSDGGFLTPAP